MQYLVHALDLIRSVIIHIISVVKISLPVSSPVIYVMSGTLGTPLLTSSITSNPSICSAIIVVEYVQPARCRQSWAEIILFRYPFCVVWLTSMALWQ